MYFSYPSQCPFCNFRGEYERPQGNKLGPPGGFPSGPQGGPQGFQPGGPQGGPPSAPPPSLNPSKNQPHVQSYSGLSTKAIESGAIRPCKYRYVYIWLRNGMSFWAWLNYVGRKSISGWRWTGYRWVYFGMDLRRIDSFICY